MTSDAHVFIYACTIRISMHTCSRVYAQYHMSTRVCLSSYFQVISHTRSITPKTYWYNLKNAIIILLIVSLVC